MSFRVFKYAGDLYAWLPATMPSKLAPVAKDRYSWDDLHIALTFNRDGNGRVTGLTAVQGGRTMQAKRAK